MNLPTIFGVVVLALVLCGCKDDASKTAADTTSPEDVEVLDTTETLDTAEEVTDDTAEEVTDAEVTELADTSEPTCEFPTPLIGATDGWVLHACGQAEYSWLEDPRLGEVTGRVQKLSMPLSVLEAALASEGLVPPRPLQYGVRVDQIRYITQDRGQLIEATALVAYPSNMPVGEPLPVLLSLHGTSGFTDLCAPSNGLAYQALSALFASWGYMVVAPDYLGLRGAGEPSEELHPYLVGIATAIASLDAVRALAQLPPHQRDGHCIKPEVLVFGGSQGGHAGLWVDRLAPYYARELHLLGIAATVPPADLVGQVERALGELVNATANTVAFFTASSFWYGHGERLGEVFLEPYASALPAAFATSCNPQFDPMPSSLEEVFQLPLLEAAQAGTLAEWGDWGCMLAENGLTTTSIARLPVSDPSYGVLFVLGEQDELVHTPIERDSVAALCAQGMVIEYLECAGGRHGETSFWALPEILDFFDARLARIPMDGTTACQVHAPVSCRGTISQ